MNPFKYGYIIVERLGNGKRFKVLAVVGDLVWTSMGDEFDRAWGEPMHWKEMNEYKVEGTV